MDTKSPFLIEPNNKEYEPNCKSKTHTSKVLILILIHTLLTAMVIAMATAIQPNTQTTDHD
jgi:flagellar basal body-associated protein FliL